MLTFTRQIPTIRFPEFSDELVEHRLRDLLVPTLREVPKPMDEFLAIGVRSHCRGTFQREEFDPEDIAMDRLYVVRANDLIVNITFAWEGAIAIVKNEDDGGLVSHRFPTYTFKDEITNADYFENLICRPRFRYLLKVISPGGAGRNRVLDKKDFLKLVVKLPSRREQQKIAAFLSAVDERIAQLSRKKELLLKYKKGVMQQIFSQKIRFKDDNGNDFPDWEEKRVGQIGDIVGGGTPETDKVDYWNGEILWFTPTEIKSKYVDRSLRRISKTGLKKSSAKLLPPGTLLLSSRATVGDVGIALNECTTNQGFQSIVVNADNVNEFIYYWLTVNKKELLRRANGSTFVEISKTEIAKIPIRVPSRGEQLRIATFLAAIDKTVDLVDQQLLKTKSFKKGLLQQMFV